MSRRGLWVALGLGLGACGDDGASSGSGASATSGFTTSGGASTTGSATEAGSGSSSAGGTSGESTTSGGVSTSGSTSMGATESSGASSGSTSGDSSTGGTTGGLPPCDPIAVPDTTEFVFSKAIEIGVSTLQAGYYDNNRQEVTVLSFYGKGKRLDVDGNILGDVEAPAEALPRLDGAAYDTLADVGLLINQDCVLVEVDPETMAAVKVTQLGFQMSICAGLAIDATRNLYIASYGTKELVVLDRDATEVILRTTIAGMPNLDGIAEIAGSDNFLVNDTVTLTAAIIDPKGGVLVPSGAVGSAPPLTGGGPVPQPDSMLTICLNGHTWVCDAYGTKCSDFAPSDGDKEACGCLIPQ